MWRTLLSLVLVGLLLVSTGGNILLLRDQFSLRAENDRLRQRAVAAENTQAGLQAQIDQLKASLGAASSPTVPAPSLGASVDGPDRATLQRIQNEVAGLRGLAPKADVPLRFLSQSDLQRYFVDSFNRDYLPSERESDQKLLETLGLLNQGDSIVQILLDVLQEQVIGVYNDDDKAMYLVGDKNQFGPEEKSTFAHEFTHALQDQYFELRTLSPKHPDNDDRALAIQAVVEGDAVLLQRLWAQQNMSSDELSQLSQGGADSQLFSAPLYVREQLLFPYGEGFNFVRQAYQTGGGYAAVDELFLHPPDSTEQVLHPEKYRAHEQPVVVSLPDLVPVLGPGWRTINSNVVGELDLRLILQQLTDQTRAVRGASGWGGDRFALLEKDGRTAFVLSSVWDGDNEARNFFDTFGLALRNRFAGARQEEASATRQALTASTAATELRRNGRNVVAVISFDRPSAEQIASAVIMP
jgi:hypothetical protein